MDRKRYTDNELKEMRQLKMEGKTFKEIAEIYGRTSSAVAQKFAKLGWISVLKWPPYEPESEHRVIAEETKPVTLNDFTPREIFKHLYKLGYRINKDGKIVCLVEQVVNIKDVLEN